MVWIGLDGRFQQLLGACELAAAQGDQAQDIERLHVARPVLQRLARKPLRFVEPALLHQGLDVW